MFSFVVLSLFPEQTRSFFLKGLIKQSFDRGDFDFSVIDLRLFGQGKHLKVDAYPYGGKQGMVLRADVLYEAIVSIPNYQDYELLSPCPKGFSLTHTYLNTCSQKQTKGFVLIPGYYEGIDVRLFELLPIHRFKVGSFVMSSGELPALMFCDALIRRLPGVLGNERSWQDDSFEGSLLEYPQYSQPRDVHGLCVPDVLVSGHHDNVKTWKQKMALKETLFNEPNLLLESKLDDSQREQLVHILQEVS